MKKLLYLFALLILSLYSVALADDVFTDVHKGDPYYNEITALEKKGILFGYPDGSYKPKRTLTRAEFSSIVVRALGLLDKEYTETLYTDLDNTHWAYQYIQIASAYDLVKGNTGGDFKPNDPVNRLEILAIMTNALEVRPLTYDETTKILSEYKDGSLVPSWAGLKTAQAINIGLVVPGKKGAEYLAPIDNATRAEVAGFIVKMLDAFEKMPAEKLKKQKIGIRLFRGDVVESAYSDGKYTIIPAGTTLPLAIMDCSLNTPFENEMDFRAKVRKHYITKNNRLLIPANSEVYGKIKEVRPAKYFRRNDRYVLETVYFINSRNNTQNNISAVAVIEPVYNGKNILDKINYYIIRGKKVVVHKSTTGNFVLTEPYKIEIIEEYVNL